MPLDTTTWPTTEADETTKLLIRARGFLERGWCRNTLARDSRSREVSPQSARAVRWCAYGALEAAGWSGRLVDPVIRRLKAAIGDSGGIAQFNNTQETVEPVLAAFDRAIAAGQETPTR